MDETTALLHLSAHELETTRHLSCFTLHLGANVVDEIIFDIVLGNKPHVDVKIETTDRDGRAVVDCLVQAKQVTTVQLIDEDNRVLVDTSRDGGLVPAVDGMTYKVRKEVASGRGGRRRIICVAYTPFGVGQGIGTYDVGSKGNKSITACHREP